MQWLLLPFQNGKIVNIQRIWDRIRLENEYTAMRWMSNNTIGSSIRQSDRKFAQLPWHLIFGVRCSVCVCVYALCLWKQCQHDYRRVVHCNLLVVADAPTMHLIGLIHAPHPTLSSSLSLSLLSYSKACTFIEISYIMIVVDTQSQMLINI